MRLLGTTKTVLLLSGGLDSAVLATLLVKKGYDLYPLFVNYGQLAAAKEQQSSFDICNFLQIRKLTVIQAQGIADLATSNELTSEVADSPLFPNRNMILLSLAATYASKVNCSGISIGITKASPGAPIYPDCTSQFLQLANSTIHISCDRSISIFAPLADMTKDQIVELAIKEKLPLGITYSCFRGKEFPCGQCQGCISRKSAIAKVPAC